MIARFLSPLLLRAGLRYQLQHRWQAALALIGIAIGVAVVLAVDLANSAAKASFAHSAEQLRGAATHRLLGRAGDLDQGLYTRLYTTPGHPPMAPVITAGVRLAGRPERLRLIGLDLFAEGAFRPVLPQAIEGGEALGDWLSTPGLVALSRSAADALGVTQGDSLEILHQGKAHTLQVYAIADTDPVGSRDMLVVDIATAQQITGRGGLLSHIDLLLDAAAADWLQGRLPDAVRLVDIDQQTAAVGALSDAFALNLTAMSLLALLVGLFLIFNAMSFSVVQRRRLLARLRAVGVQPHEISRLILGEALVLALIGTLAGVLLGVWLGQGLTAIVATTVSELYYQVTADALHIEARSLLKAVALGIGGTLLASWLPARQAARTPPLTTLSRAALEHNARRHAGRLAAIGLLLGAAGLWIALQAPGGVVTGFVGLFMLLLGAALCAPAALRLLHLLLELLPLAGVWRMATRDLDRHLSRIGTATAALMVALSASIGVAVMVDSMRMSVSNWLGDLLTADLYVAAPGMEDGAPLPRGFVRQVTTLPPVSAFSSYRDRRIRLDDRPLRLVGAHLAEPSRDGFQLIDSAAQGPWTVYGQGGLLISEPLAYRSGLLAGDRLVLPTPQGDRPFTIAAIFRDYASEHGRIFIDAAHYRLHWQDDRVNTLALFSPQGGRELLAAVEDLASDDFVPTLTVAREIHQESMAVFERTFRITEVLRLLALLVAFVGVLSALMAIQLERRKEYAVLRALGLTRRQIAQLISIESGLLGLLAALLALPTGLAMAWILTDSIQLRAFGWSMPFTVPAGPLLGTVLLGVTAALLSSIYPAWRFSRQDPAPQMRED